MKRPVALGVDDGCCYTIHRQVFNKETKTVEGSRRKNLKNRKERRTNRKKRSTQTVRK